MHNVLSLPLRLPDVVVGAINVYAHGKDAFDEHAVELGELFAAPAAVAVHNARVLAQARRVIGQSEAALTTRAMIDQAIGILISRSGGTPEETFDALRTISQREQRKLSGVARHVADEAPRRARAPRETLIRRRRIKPAPTPASRAGGRADGGDETIGA